MEYLLVTNATTLLRHVNDHYHVRHTLDCGVIFETNCTASETAELFNKINESTDEPFTLVRLTRIQPYARCQSIIDVCSTSWVK